MSERAATIDALVVSLSPEEMKVLAIRLAAQVGYVLTAEAIGHGRHRFCQPGDEPDQIWMLRFSDPSLRTMIWIDEDARNDAIAAWNKYSPSYNCYLLATVDRDAAAQEDDLSWFGQNVGLELSWGAEDEESDAFWRVHRRNGSVNDREWTLVAIGRTPAQAIANARAALTSTGKVS